MANFDQRYQHVETQYNADEINVYQPALSLTEKQRKQNRTRMLERVQAIWIDGVLEPSVQGPAQIALALQSKPSAVVTPLWHVLREFDKTGLFSSTSTSIVQVYDHANGELLILGEPGAGKTILLLELTRALLERARQDEAHPIPVVFLLSSWATRCLPLSEWLAAELHDRYQVPLPLATSWIETDQVLPLLDGLDEVAMPYRAACIEAINAYRRTHGLLPTVVSSRQTDYLTLSTRLMLRTAVAVLPLTPEQIEAYLTSGGEQLEALREMLRIDADLRALASTPLMLNVFTAAYQGTTRQEIDTTGSPHMKQEQVFASYVERMLTHRSSSMLYRPEQTMHWLSSLARQMKRQSQTVFYIENMQFDWLSGNLALKMYAWLAVLLPGMLIGMLVGLAITAALLLLPTADNYGPNMLLGGLLGGLFSSRSATQLLATNGGKAKSTSWRRFLQRLLIGVLFGLGVGLLYGLLHGLRVGLLYGLIFCLCGILIQVLLVKNNTMQSLIQTPLPDWKTKWQRLIRSPALRNGLLVGLLVGLSYGLLALLLGGINWRSYALWLELGLIFGFTSGVLSLLLIGRKVTIQLADRLTWSWTSLGRSLRKSQHIRATLQIMVLIGLILGLLNARHSGVTHSLLYSLIFGLSNGLGSGVGLGLGYWFFLGLFQGVSGETIGDQQRLIPNQGIHRTALNSFVFGLMSSIVGILSFELGNELGYLVGYVWIYGLYYVPSLLTINGPIFGLTFGLLAGLLMGGLACERHYVLRVLLWRDRAIPWNYTRFLDFASESILLRKVGGGYIFLHRLLLDYFANLETETGSDGSAESSPQRLLSVAMPPASEESMRADEYSHMPMVPPALTPVFSETPHGGNAALVWVWGAFFGIILGVIWIIVSLLPLGGIIGMLIWLIGFFLIGLLAARQSGRVRAGALVGLVTGLISGLIVVLLFALTSMARDPQITQADIVGIVIGLIVIVALIVGLGAGIGALGGLVGRRQTTPVASTSIADTLLTPPPSAQSQYPPSPGPTQSQE